MTLIEDTLSGVLKKIVPTDQELTLINEIVERLRFLLEKRAKEINVDFSIIEPQGSTGIKQTQLRNDFDIDLFIGLNYEQYEPNYKGLSKNRFKKESKKDFLKLCNNWIIKALTSGEFSDPRMLYAEHPYVTVDYFAQDTKIKLDIVLYFELELDFIKTNGPKTAVDRSPWHGRFVRDNLTNEQKNHVRLLKQFFKACHSYGDKSALGKAGFIGYSAELLIHHFKTIQNVFENFNNLKDIPIDYFKRNKEELEKIIHFQNDYLIITDPVDMNRNVASAISEKAYKYCNQKIKDLLLNPNEDFFIIKPIPTPTIDLSNSNDPLLSKIFILELKSKSDDVHYTINRDKLHSLGDSIKANAEKEFSHAEKFGEIIYEVYFEEEISEYNLAIYCDKLIISSTYRRKGPPITAKKHMDKFKEKNPSFFEKEGYLWVENKRNFTDFSEFLKDFVKNKIYDNLELINLSKSFKTQTISGKRTIYVLKEMVLPFYGKKI